MDNPGKFQFMILSKNTNNKSSVISNENWIEWNKNWIMKTMKIELLKSVKLLWLTIDNKFNLGIHINNICKVASAKIIYAKWLVRK